MSGRDVLRRALDLLLSGCGLILLAPVFAVIAGFILVLDGRPVLFRQWRVGKNGKLFKILKFRTMREARSAPSVTASGDARVTPLGARLRRFKLDELPQLINVWKGEMSLIGPRPEVPKFVDFDDPCWKAVLEVRPGITDIATLLYRDEEEILGPAPDPEDAYRRNILPRKLKLNMAYLTGRSWRSDLVVLWLSLRYSLFPAQFDRGKVAARLFRETTPPNQS